MDIGLAVIGLCISPLLQPDSRHPLTGMGLLFGLFVTYFAVEWWKAEPKRWDG